MKSIFLYLKGKCDISAFSSFRNTSLCEIPKKHLAAIGSCDHKKRNSVNVMSLADHGYLCNYFRVFQNSFVLFLLTRQSMRDMCFHSQVKMGVLVYCN